MGFWGPLLGGIASGVLGAFSSKKQQEANVDFQKEFAQQGVRWKVEDAQRAGVHPLFALGAQTTPFTPNPVVPTDYGVGEAISRAVPSRTTEELELLRAQIEATRAQTANDFSQASYWAALDAKTRSEAAPASPWPELSVDQDDYKRFGDERQVFNPYSSAIVRRLDPQTLFGPEVGSALEARGGLANEKAQPGWSKFDFGDGPIVLPYTPPGQGLMESLEGLDVKYLPAVIAENVRRYGRAGGVRMKKLYTDFGGGGRGGQLDRKTKIGPSVRPYSGGAR